MQGPSLHFIFDSSLNILILFNLFTYFSLAIFCTLFVLLTLALVQVENKDTIPMKRSISTAMISSIPAIFIQSYFFIEFIINQYLSDSLIYLLVKTFKTIRCWYFNIYLSNQ